MIKVNGEELNVTIFSDNTSQVWKVPIVDTKPDKFKITWEFSHEGELFHLAQLVSLIRQARVPVPIHLHMPYLPYGRQDKHISNETTFALRVFARMLKMMNFDKITTIDAHSNVISRMVPFFANIHPSNQISKALRAVEATAIAFPDKGACDRYFGKDETIGHELIIGHKVRNQLTGHIEKYEIEGNPKGRDVLIIDDICDRGMTFRLMTKKLLEQNAKEVNLYVSHGIFPDGICDILDSGISRIFTHKGEVFLQKDESGRKEKTSER